MWTKKKGNEEAESFQDSRRCVGGDEQESRRFRKGGIYMQVQEIITEGIRYDVMGEEM